MREEQTGVIFLGSLFIGFVLGVMTTGFIASSYCNKKGYEDWVAWGGCFNKKIIYQYQK